MSMYAPQPTSNTFCYSSSYLECRIYTSFLNRKYYVIGTINSGAYNYMAWNGTVYQPPSCDYDTAYYTTFVGWTSKTDVYYYATYSRNLVSDFSTYLAPAQPDLGNSPVIFGSNLYGYPTTLQIAVNLNGRTVYSNTTNYG